MAVDPTNFNHILLGSHQMWGANSSAPGIMETRDGGATWILHNIVSTLEKGSVAIAFLYDPATGQGDANTWLVETEGQGFWRTTNAGASWVKVADFHISHGGAQINYTSDGWVYSGAANYPVRSHDNGVTWEQLTNGLMNWYYYAVGSDGDTLYTQISYTGDNGGQGSKPYMTAPQAGAGPWSAYQGGSQTFTDGPFVMHYDAANKIMYSANWRAGIWALKTKP
jgi:hypothetical protein